MARFETCGFVLKVVGWFFAASLFVVCEVFVLIVMCDGFGFFVLMFWWFYLRWCPFVLGCILRLEFGFRCWIIGWLCLLILVSLLLS